ncbi:unnamed protein product, partial [Brenthis ino]
MTSLSTNIVINELLCFLQNKCDVLDEVSIIRLCATSFKTEDVEKAKTILFDFVPTEKGRKIMRKRENKIEKDLQDMIKVLKECESELFPKFVAYDLSKLPPVTFDHIDVSRFLVDIRVLQEELQNIKVQMRNKCDEEVFKTCVEQLRSEIVTQKVCESSKNKALQPLPVSNSNRERHARVVDPGPVETLSVSTSNRIENVSLQASHQHEPKKNATYASMTAITSPEPRSLLKKHTEHSNKIEENPNPWINVTYKKNTNRFQGKLGIGKVETSSTFKSADIKVPLYISNVDKNTSERDICEYVQSKTQEKITIQKLTMKEDKQYCSYKIFVSRNKLDLYLNSDIWPEGIMFRRFIQFRKYKNNNQNGEK